MGEPVYVIDSPTAGILADGEYSFQGRLGPESSILLGLRVGFANRLHVGVSFGMQRVFERGDLEFNDKIGFQIRIRLLEELDTPALAIGFNSQGVGLYHEDAERYDRKAAGSQIAALSHIHPKNCVVAKFDPQAITVSHPVCRSCIPWT